MQFRESLHDRQPQSEPAATARERNVLSLEDAVWMITGLPARRLRLSDRGIRREGARADLVLFDPQTSQDTATYTDPHQLATGIDYVFVNGQPALANGRITGELAGTVLRRAG